jgi:hypothetical protein
VNGLWNTASESQQLLWQALELLTLEQKNSPTAQLAPRQQQANKKQLGPPIYSHDYEAINKVFA